VAVLDAYGDVLKLDTGPGASQVTLSLLTPNPGGSLTSSSGLTKKPVDGVAKWTKLKVSQTGVYQIVASSSLPWVDQDDGLPIKVTN
jgi:hypothetical protein